MGERVLDLLAHLCALAALTYTARGATLLRGWITVPHADGDALPMLSVIVPARNEERSIARCISSLLDQRLGTYEVIVVDDRSDDATPAILEALSATDPRLHVVTGAPLPEGWVGKPWALAQGALAATGEWLLFTDADTWHAPDACASTLAFARARGVDAVTLWVYQELGTLGERAVLPTILGMVLVASGSLRDLNDPARPQNALANGQYVLVSRAAYDALGGHAALRDEIVEDVAFARRLKADGRFRLLVADGAALVRVRMYTSLGELWAGFTKNMYAGARGDLRALGGAAAFLSLLSVVPAALAVDALVRRKKRRALEALGVLAAGMVVQTFGFRRTGIPLANALFAPIGYAACAAIVLNSTLRVLSGRGVAWRGRTYSGRAGEPGP